MNMQETTNMTMATTSSRRRSHHATTTRATRSTATTTNTKSRRTTMSPVSAVSTVALLLVGGSLPSRVHGAISCTTNKDCEESLGRVGSICLEDSKTCSNPFQRGCLNILLPKEHELSKNIRVCNSDDILPDAIQLGLCYQPDFQYEELRIHNGNWESSIFLSWIMQILLSEVVEVPTTVGLGGGNEPYSTRGGSFYNVENTLPYSSSAYPWNALGEATLVGDCRLSTNECTHVLPEVWNGQLHEWTKSLNEGNIDPVEGNGQVGKGSWYVPTFTAQRDDSLVSVFGLSGEENRAKLADAFRKPITWKEYCEEVSLSNCTEPDTIATRYPTSESEKSMYYSGSDSYIGHFRLTEANNCTINPTTCSGHIIGPPCTWSTNVDSQLYWNDIKLIPDGPVMPNGGYEYGSMVQIWRAADATKSNVVFWWWKPDALVEEFHGTESQFQQILLPEATDVCQRARVDTEARCSEDIKVRRGVAEGACDQEAHALQKVFARSLQERTYSVPPASRSPGYDLLQNLKINDLEINNMIRRWQAIGIDQYGNDAREAVCGWVVENLDALLDSVPEGYPRILSNQSSYDVGYLRFAQVVATCTALLVPLVACATFKYRKTKVFVFAQVYLCWLIFIGYFLVSLGSIVTTLEPEKVPCTMRVWLLTLGYTVALVPLLVKISAINKILQSAEKMKRVHISRKRMMQKVYAVVFLATIFLTVWTIVDPPAREEFLRLESERSQVVFTSVACSSEMHHFWYLVALGWQILLLIIASVLAFQSRNVVQDFNESRSLGTMVYSHFLFVVCRTVLFFLGRQSDTGSDGILDMAIVKPHVVATLECILLSFDTIFGLLIYILPKLVEAKIAPDDYDPKKHGSIVRSVNSVAMSNISMIESRAAEARKSYMTSQSSESVDRNSGSGGLLGWPSLRRSGGSRRSSLFSNTSATSRTNTSADDSRRSSSGMLTKMGSQSSLLDFQRLSSKNLFSAGSVPIANGRGEKRVSMVPEGSCEISLNSGFSLAENSGQFSAPNISSKHLQSPNTSSRHLASPQNSERMLSHPTIRSNEELGDPADVVDEENQHHSGLDDLQSEELNDLQGPRSTDGAGRMGGSFASSNNSKGSHLGEFAGDDDESLSDSSDEPDYGGPRWSKPELNDDLNISVHSADDDHRRGQLQKSSSSRRSVNSVDDPRVSSTGRRRRSSASFSRPRLARARKFKPMPVIRSTSIDLPNPNVPRKDLKPAANSPVIDGVIEEDPDPTTESPVSEEEYLQQSSFRKI